MADGKPKGRDMRLRILACRHVYHGKNQRGDEYDIYEIEAAKPDGSPVREKLRSFAPLAIGQEIEVTVTAFNSQRHGRSFTLNQKGSRSASTTGQLNELRKHVSELENRIAALVKRVEALEVSNGSRLSSERPVQARPVDPALSERFGDDAPW